MREASAPVDLGSNVSYQKPDNCEDLLTESESSRSKGFGLSQKISYLKNHWLTVGVIALVSVGAMGAGLKYLEQDATRVKAERSKATPLNPTNEGLLAKVNPFLPAPMPNPTPQLSKEYIYAGSRLLAVEDKNANAAPPADLAIWRPSTGVWWVLGGPGSQQTAQGWGTSGDIPVPGDFDGDGKTDFSVFRPSTGVWYILKSSVVGSGEYYYFGTGGDIPAVADYDGDGKTDAAVFRPSNGTWYIRQSSTTQLVASQFGISGDKPAAKDYDGDGKADMAFWRSTGTPTFYVLRSSNGQLQTQAYGISGDVPASADYDGDGKADFSVRRGASWYVLKSSDGGTLTYSWGLETDTEVPNDYDGDGKADIAVWRNSNGTWYILNSSGNPATRTVGWGTAGDIPVPAFYRR